MNNGTGTHQAFIIAPVLLTLAVLAGCSSGPEPARADEVKPRTGCTQSDWQAQTAPVIGKREGNEALEQYRKDTQEQGSGCR